jgi:hypothetical protein
MATDGPTPKPCDRKIFREGQPIALLDGSSNAVENWVQAVAKRAEARVDWHYSGGVAQVLFLGDADERARVEQAILALIPELNGNVIAAPLAPGDQGRTRNF